MDQALVPFQNDHYLARKKVFAMLGQQFHIYGPDGSLKFYVKQKAFKLKEAITVFEDEAQTKPVLQIQARSIMGFSGIYDVSTIGGQRLGALKREGLKSMLRDEWTILDPSDTPIGMIQEDSQLFALLRRFLANLIPQRFDVTVNGQLVAEFNQHFNPFVAKFDIDFTKGPRELLDRRMGIAAVVLLLAIEGRQQ
jgi:uncharacterized protein YxjI